METDEYEEAFIQAKTKDSGASAEYHRSVILSYMRLFKAANSRKPDEVNRMLGGELLGRLADAVQRGKFYESLYDHFDLQMQQKHPLFSWRGAAYTFVPVLIVEWEGPVKQGLRAAAYLRQIENGDSISWEDFRNQPRVRYLSDVLRTVKADFRRDDPIWLVADGLDPEDHPVKANMIRRAAAHADFVVYDSPDHRAIVAFFDHGRRIEMDTYDLLGMVSYTQDLVRLLHVCIHLGVRRVTGMPRDLGEARRLWDHEPESSRNPPRPETSLKKNLPER